MPATHITAPPAPTAPGLVAPATADAPHLPPRLIRGRRTLLAGLTSAAWLHLAVLLVLMLVDRSGHKPGWWAVFGLTATAGVMLAVRQRPASGMHGTQTALTDAALLGALMAGSLWCTRDPARTRLALAGLPYVLVLLSPSKYPATGTALATAATYGAVSGVTAWSQLALSAGHAWDWPGTLLIWWPLGLTALGTYRVTRLLRAHAEAHQRVSAGARTDPLTGLANRTAFFHDAERSVRAALTGDPACSLLLIDLDGLKDINDSFGHTTGDAALRHMGRALAAQAPPGDLVARLGGDEFAVLMHHPPGREEEAVARYARILDGTLYRDPTSGWTVLLSGSWGMATAGRHGRTLLELLAHADEDLIHRKSLPRERLISLNTEEPPFIPRGRRALADTYSSLLELARDVATATDGDELLMRAATRAAELVGASAAAVAIVRPGQRRGIRARRTAGGWQYEPVSFPGPHSILQHVLTTASPYICNDTATDPRADQEAARRLGITNCLCVPLRGTDGSVFGTVFLTNKLGRVPFNQQDQRLALAFADLAAAALQRTEALAAARQDASAAEVLLRALAPVYGALGRNDALARMLREAATALQVETAMLALIDGDGAVRPVAVYPPNLSESSCSASLDGVIERVVATAEPLLIDEPAPEPATPGLSPEHRSQAVVPIRTGAGRVIGVVAMRSAPGRPLTRRQLHLLEVVAHHMAGLVQHPTFPGTTVR